MNNKFSENLKKIRKEHNLSQEQLADELGVSRQAISKWESSQAYPEMDKIIALCDKFNLNIDDLLHRDIKEVKSEEESKNKINKGIDDCLNFITNTVNMFSNMTFKQKIKCLIEQLIIILILFIVSNVILEVFRMLIFQLFNFLPSNINVIIQNVMDAIIGIVCIIASIIIVINVFKTRYLDYYNNIKNDKEDNTNEEEINIKEETKEEKKEIKRDNKKIIIRDPEHSEYKFINGLFKFIILIIKFVAACIAFSLCATLIGLFIGFILSFLIYKTGTFFIGLLLTLFAAAIITIIILLILLNFIFNRKNDKKKMIWSFILSLVLIGIGIGLIAVSSLDFKVYLDDQDFLVTKKIELDYNDTMFFDYYEDEIEYVESNNKNIIIEYKANKHCELKYRDNKKEGVYLWTNCNDPMSIVKDTLKNINNKKIIPIMTDTSDIVVHTSKENIKKLKSNYASYIKENEDKRYKAYEERIAELEEKVNEYEEKISELEEE